MAVLRGLLLAWLQTAETGDLVRLNADGDDQAAVDALIELNAKNLIRFEYRETAKPGIFHFSVVVPPEVKATLAQRAGHA